MHYWAERIWRGNRETRWILSIVILIALLGFFSTSYAQSPFDQGGLTLVSEPRFPKPNTNVTISLDDYSLETTGATITWYRNGVEETNNKNERNITLNTGSVGTKTTIRVALTRANAPSIGASIVVIPSKVDIILETNTYVPYFYQGRSLPSGESQIRATAVVHDGTTVPDTSYTYKWMIGSTVFSGGPLTGKNSIDFELPHYDNGGLTVEVLNANGETIGYASTPLTSFNPELHFYEYSPLRGLYQKAVMDPFLLTGEETTVYGEPYFLNAQLDPASADFIWKINGEETRTGEAMPNAITLRRIGNAGNATVQFTAITKKRIPQFVDGRILTTF